MKKKLYLILAAALMLSISACAAEKSPVPEKEPVSNTSETVKWPAASEMNEYDEAEYWNETAGWLYYFTREKFGRSYKILSDPSAIAEDEKPVYAETLLYALAYAPSGSTLFTTDAEGTLTGDADKVNEAVSELFGFDISGYGSALLKEGKYAAAPYDFDDYRPEAVTGAYGLSESNPLVSGDVSITSNGQWLASQKFDLQLKDNAAGKYSRYTFVNMEITWVAPEECVTTLEAKARKDALTALTTTGKGGGAE